MGTFIFGAVNQAFQSLRLGIVSLIVFFVFGLLFLLMVNVGKAMAEAKAEPHAAEPA
jgi:MFS-type transporter involved in bile tolerance (Atg22 family)